MAKIWESLINEHQAVQDPQRVRQVRLLSGLILAHITGNLCIVAWVNLNFANVHFVNQVATVSTCLEFVAYLLIRSPYVATGTGLFLFTIWVESISIFIGTESSLASFSAALSSALAPVIAAFVLRFRTVVATGIATLVLATCAVGIYRSFDALHMLTLLHLAVIVGISTLGAWVKSRYDRKIEEHNRALSAQQSVTTLSSLFGGFAHQVSNPLAIIQNYCVALRRNADNPAKVELCANKIESVIDHANNVIVSMKRLVDSDHTETLEEHDILAAINDAAIIMKPQLAATGWRIELGHLEEAPVAWTSPGLVNQLILAVLRAIPKKLDDVTGEKIIRISIWDREKMAVTFTMPPLSRLIEDTEQDHSAYLESLERELCGYGGLCQLSTMLHKHEGEMQFEATEDCTEFKILLEFDPARFQSTILNGTYAA